MRWIRWALGAAAALLFVAAALLSRQRDELVLLRQERQADQLRQITFAYAGFDGAALLMEQWLLEQDRGDKDLAADRLETAWLQLDRVALFDRDDLHAADLIARDPHGDFHVGVLARIYAARLKSLRESLGRYGALLPEEIREIELIGGDVREIADRIAPAVPGVLPPFPAPVAPISLSLRYNDMWARSESMPSLGQQQGSELPESELRINLWASASCVEEGQPLTFTVALATYSSVVSQPLSVKLTDLALLDSDNQVAARWPADAALQAATARELSGEDRAVYRWPWIASATAGASSRLAATVEVWTPGAGPPRKHRAVARFVVGVGTLSISGGMNTQSVPCSALTP